MTYTYDGDGKRVKKSNRTLYWTGPGWDPFLETDLSGNATAEYVFFNGKRVARVDMPGNSPKYYFEDHLGSTDIVTNPTGGIVEESDYVPYGGEVVISGSDPNHFKFTGKERDLESGLDYFDARHYSSPFGRFMTPDWATTATAVPYANFGNPQSLNLYSYVQNNPTTMGDPDGHGADSPLEQDPQGSMPQSTPATGWLADVGKSLANSGISGLNSLVRMAMHGEWAPQLPEFNVNSKSANVVGTVLSLAIPIEGEEAGTAKAAQMLENAAKGKAFQEGVAAETLVRDGNAVQNVTLKTESGVKTVMDVVSKEKTGNVALQEAKSSKTARLTKNQAAAHPEIQETGATVVGQGKPGFPGGTKIPPTKVKVKRP